MLIYLLLLTELLGFWTFSIVWYSREHDVSETGCVSETSCSLEYQTMEKFKNPVILSVIHHRQNRLESTSTSTVNYPCRQ
jgi:hypothetical protein